VHSSCVSHALSLHFDMLSTFLLSAVCNIFLCVPLHIFSCVYPFDYVHFPCDLPMMCSLLPSGTRSPVRYTISFRRVSSYVSWRIRCGLPYVLSRPLHHTFSVRSLLLVRVRSPIRSLCIHLAFSCVFSKFHLAFSRALRYT